MNLANGQEKKSVGIITMHKVQNFGSALQAFALQYIICGFGFNVQLIDYIFPNEAHGKTKRGLLERIKTYVGQKFNLTSGCVVLNKFDRFYKKFFSLSDRYLTVKDIRSNPPKYDIYIKPSEV